MKYSKNKTKKLLPALGTHRHSGLSQPPEPRLHKSEQAAVVIVRTERRSWLALAITGFGAVLLRYLRTVRERTRQIRLFLHLLVLVLMACELPKPQKGGRATTTISQPGHTNAVTLVQSENPKEPSKQTVQTEQTLEYVIPAGTIIQLPESPTADAGLMNSQPSVRGAARLERTVPVKLAIKDRTETTIGGAQKDSVREWAMRAANMQPVMWAGIVMMTAVAGVLAYFGWWTKAALALVIGAAMIVIAQALPDQGVVILFGGLGLFGVAALLILYAYHKGLLDQNRNGILDFLERSPRESADSGTQRPGS